MSTNPIAWFSCLLVGGHQWHTPYRYKGWVFRQCRYCGYETKRRAK
jgi:hypothetical protein